MSIEKFRETFSGDSEAEDLFPPRKDLPENPNEFKYNPFLESALTGYKDKHPDLFKIFKAGALYPRVNYYETGSENKKLTAKADTTERSAYQIFDTLVPALTANARRSDGNRTGSVQYELRRKGKPAKEIKSQMKQSEEIFDEIIESDMDSEKEKRKAWALLAGIVSMGRGSMRVVTETDRHDPSGDIRVQFDVSQEDDPLNQLIRKLAPDLIKNPNLKVRREQKDEPTPRIEIAGENAFEFIKRLTAAAPPVAFARPEIDFMLGYASGKVEPGVAFSAYAEYK